jgi:hypothetical protein
MLNIFIESPDHSPAMKTDNRREFLKKRVPVLEGAALVQGIGRKHVADSV